MPEPKTTLDDWFAIIGRVIVAAANLEGAVGILASTLVTGQTDRFFPWMLGELDTKCRAEIGKITDDDLRGRLLTALDQVNGLARRRNDVVHGWIRFGGGDDGRDAIIGRSRRDAPELTITKIQYQDLSRLLGELERARRTVLNLAEAVAITIHKADP